MSEQEIHWLIGATLIGVLASVLSPEVRMFFFAVPKGYRSKADQNL